MFTLEILHVLRQATKRYNECLASLNPSSTSLNNTMSNSTMLNNTLVNTTANTIQKTCDLQTELNNVSNFLFAFWTWKSHRVANEPLKPWKTLTNPGFCLPLEKYPGKPWNCIPPLKNYALKQIFPASIFGLAVLLHFVIPVTQGKRIYEVIGV